jgi:CheY-like chemotaxis protein
MMAEKKIFLFADDDIDDREMFTEALSTIDSNLVCITVADGREVLHTLSSLEQLPELIFLDVNMPMMNGWQCLENLKKDDRYCKIPVIIISTSSHQREIDIAKSLGALCYFTKPHEYKDLVHVLQSIVANSGPQLSSTLQGLEANGSGYLQTLFTQK